MIRRVLHSFVFTICLVGIVHAQNLTTSPYSYFGIGDIEQFNNGQTAALGGAGIGLSNKYHINLKNPASYYSYDTLSFKFEFGVKSKITTIQSNELSETVDDHGVSYFAMGFPVTKKWRSSIALVPLSSVGYKIKDVQTYDTIGIVESIYTGEGGLNQIILGNSFKINNSLSVGLNASYVFGKISNYRALLLPASLANKNSISQNNLNIKGFLYQVGLQYHGKLNEKYNYGIGVSFENQSSYNIDESSISGITQYDWENYLDNGTLDDTISSENNSGKLSIPNKIGVGISFTDNEHLLIALDYEMQNWKNAEMLGSNLGLSNYNRISGGLEFVPERNHAKFFKRMRYRIGGNYSNTYLNINGNQLTSAGVTLGFGIPVKRSKTSFNLNFEYGQRGTTDNNLIKENYAIISLTLSLSDIWFYKRKFD